MCTCTVTVNEAGHLASISRPMISRGLESRLLVLDTWVGSGCSLAGQARLVTVHCSVQCCGNVLIRGTRKFGREHG